MKKLFHTLAIITCVPSLSLCMEMQQSSELQKTGENPIISPVMPEKIYRKKMNDLYVKTYATLAKYDHHNAESVNQLFPLIAETATLTLGGVTEKEIGLFAYKQTSPWQEILGEFPGGPLYVSIFFERIRRYNELLKKNEFTHPTQKNYADHIINKNTAAIQAAQLKAIDAAVLFGIHLEKSIIEEDKSAFVHIPEIIAVQEFDKLTIDVHKIRNENRSTITALADVLYTNKLIKKESK
jgi:hypothetical protein